MSALHRALKQQAKICSRVTRDDGLDPVCECITWIDATASTGAFGNFVSCNDEVLHGMSRAHSRAPHTSTATHDGSQSLLSSCLTPLPMQDISLSSSSSASAAHEFKIRPLRCVIAEKVGDTNPCGACGIGDGKKVQRGKCSCFSTESLNQRVVWLKRQDTVEGKGMDQVRVRLRSYSGTFQELLEWVESNYKAALHHKWRVRFIRHQFHLNCDYFEDDSAVVLADFASAMVRNFNEASRLPVVSYFVPPNSAGSWLWLQRNM